MQVKISPKRKRKSQVSQKSKVAKVDENNDNEDTDNELDYEEGESEEEEFNGNEKVGRRNEDLDLLGLKKEDGRLIQEQPHAAAHTGQN